MQFTKAEGYGILGIIYLAERGAGRIVPLSEIAESQNVPEKFLAKIFQNLTKTGLVRSHRGVKGGFSFNGNVNEITAIKIVEAIQGPYALAKCFIDAINCDKYDSCPVRVLLEKVQKAMLEVFQQYTLADLLKLKNDMEGTCKKLK
jgi:Rrf2 family protein